MNLNYMVKVVLRYFAIFLVLSAFSRVIVSMLWASEIEGFQSARISAASAAGLIGGLVWIYSGELAHWLIRSQYGAVLQGVRTASLIFALVYFPNTLEESIVWVINPPDIPLSAFQEITVSSHAEPVSRIVFFCLAVALLFLSPNIQSYIDRSKKLNLIRAKIDAESSVKKCATDRPGRVCPCSPRTSHLTNPVLT